MSDVFANDDELLCKKFLRERGVDADELILDHWDRRRRSYDEDIPLLGSARLNSHLGDTMRETRAREDYIDQFGFAILSMGAVEAIRPYQPLVELGAGSGYWSYELQRFGIDVIATDPFDEMFWSFRREKRERWQKLYTSIEKLNSVEAIRKYPKRVPLIVWPSYDESWAADALDIYTGETVIYFGEGEGNATADDRFHQLLDTNFADQHYVRMPHFWGCYDRWLIIAKKPKQLTKG